MAPSETEARLGGACRRLTLSQVRPIFLFRIEQAPLPLDQFERCNPEPLFTRNRTKLQERPGHSGGSVRKTGEQRRQFLRLKAIPQVIPASDRRSQRAIGWSCAMQRKQCADATCGAANDVQFLVLIDEGGKKINDRFGFFDQDWFRPKRAQMRQRINHSSPAAESANERPGKPGAGPITVGGPAQGRKRSLSESREPG